MPRLDGVRARRRAASRGCSLRPTPGNPAFIDNLPACDGLLPRPDAFDQRLAGLAREQGPWPLVSRLPRFAGWTHSRALVLEAANFEPFQHAVRLGSARLGSAHGCGWCPPASNPPNQTHGSITKSSSKYTRRILVQGDGTTPARRIGRTLAECHDVLPDDIHQIARRRQHRRLPERKKPGSAITVACARKSSFLWTAATAPRIQQRQQLARRQASSTGSAETCPCRTSGTLRRDPSGVSSASPRDWTRRCVG